MEEIMNGTETLKYLNKKYGNNGVKFENTGTAIKIINAEGRSICLNENPENEKEADYLVKFYIQALHDGITENKQLQQKFYFDDDEALKYASWLCTGKENVEEFEKRFSANVDKGALDDGYFGYISTYLTSNKYEYYLTLYDVDIDREIPNELIKFEKMFDKITENKEIFVEANGYLVDIFYKDESIYEINLIEEKANEVEKYLKDKLEIQ